MDAFCISHYGNGDQLRGFPDISGIHIGNAAGSASCIK